MNLKEWAERGLPGGRESRARSHGAALLRDLTGAGDDTVVFGTTESAPSAGEVLVITLWAATEAGFATIRVTTSLDPRTPNDKAGVSVLVEAWRGIGALRLAGVSPLEDRLGLTLTIGSIAISSTGSDASDVAALYRACAGFIRT